MAEKDPAIKVSVEGYSDERGARKYNVALSARRAAALRHSLIADGISPTRIKTISHGKNHRAVLGHDEAAGAQNRRAVTVVDSPK